MRLLQESVGALMRWLLMVPAILLILFGCGQAGIASANIPESADTRSRVHVDYSPWSVAVMKPLSPGVYEVIQTDVGDEMTLASPAPGEFWSTATSTATARRPTSSPSGIGTASPSSAPVGSATVTQVESRVPEGTMGPTVTASRAPATPITPTASRTITSVVTTPPSSTPTRTRTPTPTATRTVSLPSSSTWLDCRFDYRKPITIAASRVVGNPRDFPVLVSFGSDGDLASKANDNGLDLTFTSSDGTTKLPHEIEKFNGQTGELVAWVKVPVLSSSADTVLYLYYGNTDLTSSTENPQGVWDSGFAGVWHLAESGNGSPDEYRDSGQHGNHGQGGEGSSLRVPSRVAGRVGYGQDFSNADGLHDLIDVGNDASLDINGNQITLEAWIRHNIIPQYGPYYGFLNHKGWVDGYRLVIPDNSWNISFQLPGEAYSLRSTSNVSGGEWHHVAATYDGATMRIFIDGLPDAATLAKSDNVISVPPPENDVWIGHGDQPADQPWAYAWEGQIDEVRISAAARSSAWIQTEYNNQSAPSSFHTLAGEQVYLNYCVP